MNVLVIGNGAREHVITEALTNSPQKPKVFAFMNAINPGIAKLCEDYSVGDYMNSEEVLEYTTKKGIDIAVIGPEAPLDIGLADALEEKGVMCVGPKMKAAKIETDKSFARNLMKKYEIAGCPEFLITNDVNEANDYIDSVSFDVVIKPSGLTGGKGVKIMGEHFDKEGAKEYVKEVIQENIGGLNEVVIEERLVGEEFTLQAFVDGNKIAGMPMVQDHKRAYEGDEGPNTGGMGSYCDAGFLLPFLNEKDYFDGIKIMEDTIKAIRKETGVEYKGFLYGQFMAGREGVKVIEFNARLGDPEAMNVLNLLDQDFLDVCQKMVGGMLTGSFAFVKKATVCKYLVPEGYPENPKKDLPVEINYEGINELGSKLYFASVRKEGEDILTGSSRAIAVVGIANTITEAEVIAEQSLKHINGKLFHRTDIGTHDLVQKRIDNMKDLRG